MLVSKLTHVKMGPWLRHADLLQAFSQIEQHDRAFLIFPRSHVLRLPVMMVRVKQSASEFLAGMGTSADRQMVNVREVYFGC